MDFIMLSLLKAVVTLECSISCVYTEAIVQEVFCKKDVLRNFAMFTRKHLYQGLFFNNVAGLGTDSGTSVFL